MKQLFLMYLLLASTQNVTCMGRYAQDAINLKTETLLHYATIINKLISVGIFIDYSAVYKPLYTNKAPDLIALIKQTGCLHKIGHNKRTPLEDAQYQGDADIEQLLRAAGAQK